MKILYTLIEKCICTKSAIDQIHVESCHDFQVVICSNYEICYETTAICYETSVICYETTAICYETTAILTVPLYQPRQHK